MTIRDVIITLKNVASELELAQHFRGRLTELREIHESDKETFDRVIDELLDQKYPLARPRRPK